MKKALIAMSGGVDSSVSAYIMKNNGYECVGAMMLLYKGEDINCSSEINAKDAKSIADSLSIPFYLFDCSERFNEKVIDKFIRCYECGITPNPCVECNRYLKFDELYKKSLELGCDYIVTGHYAKTELDKESGRVLLKRADNHLKDQSYFLYSLTREQIAHTLFPLGNMSKEETRALAEKIGLVTAQKKDSQDICFVADGDYSTFIEKYKNKKYPQGDFIDTEGNAIGEHRGIIHYTVGQRKGLGIAFNEPMYVKEINTENNTVMLARDEELYESELIADSINLISVDEINEPLRVLAKIRYRHSEAPATVYPLDNNKIRVVFDKAQRAITKGQAVVLYDNDIVIGGGTII